MATQTETETTVSGIQADKFFLIGSNWPKDIARLEREVANGRASLVRTVGDWQEYKVLSAHFSPLTGFKKRVKPKPE